MLLSKEMAVGALILVKEQKRQDCYSGEGTNENQDSYSSRGGLVLAVPSLCLCAHRPMVGLCRGPTGRPWAEWSVPAATGPTCGVSMV